MKTSTRLLCYCFFGLFLNCRNYFDPQTLSCLPILTQQNNESDVMLPLHLSLRPRSKRTMTSFVNKNKIKHGGQCTSKFENNPAFSKACQRVRNKRSSGGILEYETMLYIILQAPNQLQMLRYEGLFLQ